MLYQIYDFIFSNKSEKELSKIIKRKSVGNNLIIFDIGCFIGNFSKKIKTYLKDYNIDFYLFDPNIEIKKKLDSLMFKFNFFNIAFDNEEKIKKLYLNTAFPASGTSLQPITAESKGYNLSRRILLFKKKKIFSLVDVQTQTLDTFIKKNNIKKIDILKLDTEGNELNIFLGANKTLDICDIIYFEFLSEKNKYEDKMSKINQILISKNFKVIYKKRIRSISLFTKLICYDIICEKQ